jgi:hypothetical protein
VSSGYSATFFAASKQRNSNSVQGIFMYEKFNNNSFIYSFSINPVGIGEVLGVEGAIIHPAGAFILIFHFMVIVIYSVRSWI